METVVRAALTQDGVHDVVVLVDGSTDGTAAALEAGSDPRLRVVTRPNAGLVRARIEGVRAARGDVVLLLDDDVVPAPGLVAGHAAHHAGGDRLVVLGYMPVPAENRRRGSFPTALYALEYERSAERWEHESGEGILRNFWAGNFSIDRAAYLDLAPRIEARLPDVYHEDRGFGQICIDAGLTSVFDRSLLAAHHHERTVDGFMRDARRAAEGRLQLAGAGLSGDPVDPKFPIAGLHPLESAIASAGAHGPTLKALLGTAGLANRLGATKVALRLGDLGWRAKQLQTLREGRANSAS